MYGVKITKKHSILQTETSVRNFGRFVKFLLRKCGATFLRVRSSTLTKVTISGYTPGSTIYVRYHAIDKVGETALSGVKGTLGL